MDVSQTVDALVDKLTGWLHGFVLILPNLVVAILVVVLSAVVARIVRSVVRGALDRVTHYRQVNHLLASTAYIATLAIGVFVALGILQLDGAVASLLAGVGIVGLALGFAFQDIASNFISGVIMAIRRPFDEGDIIETNDFRGIVDEISLRSTSLRSFQGQTIILPNKDVFQSPLTNYSVRPERRVDLTCGVAYGDDLEKARQVALEAVRALQIHDAARPVDLYYEEFGDSSINFTLRFWIAFRQEPDYLEARSRAIIAIKAAFDREGITIPFPIRTLDFGVVGGEKLSDVLPPRFYAPNGADERP